MINIVVLPLVLVGLLSNPEFVQCHLAKRVKIQDPPKEKNPSSSPFFTKVSILLVYVTVPTQVAPTANWATVPKDSLSKKERYRLFSQKMEIFFLRAIGFTEKSFPLIRSAG